MEISCSKETSEERGSSHQNTDQVASTHSAKVSSKVGLVPEVSGELSGSFEVLANISNEKYSKQASVLRNIANVKGRPSLLLKVNTLKNYFEVQSRSDAQAIKGIIAAVKEGADE